MRVILSNDKVLTDYFDLTNCSQDEGSCGIYGMDSDGSCAVDLSDGCSCDTYSNAG